jgi:glycosyltransferase involved in cell wall biosynthesis
MVSIQNAKVAYGDSIRIRKISEFLQKANIMVSDVRQPTITRDILLDHENFKTLLLNVFPLQRSNQTIAPSINDLVKPLAFNTALNYLIKVLCKLKPDVILAETSQVGWITALAAKKVSVPCVIDVHGLIFAEAKGWRRGDWQRVMSMEKEAFENCDHLIVVSEKMKQYLAKAFHIPNRKMTTVPNGSDPQRSIAQFRHPLRVIYAGIFSYWEKVNDFLDIAKQASPQDFRFYLAGAGPMRQQLVRRINEEKIPIRYLGYIPKHEIYRILSQMQIGIATSTKDLARQVASPIKIFDYMASGLPVVTPRIGDWGNMVQEYNCGVSLDDDDIEDYVKALKILSDKAIWEIKSKSCIGIIQEKYTWDEVLKPLESVLSSFGA